LCKVYSFFWSCSYGNYRRDLSPKREESGCLREKINRSYYKTTSEDRIMQYFIIGAVLIMVLYLLIGAVDMIFRILKPRTFALTSAGMILLAGIAVQASPPNFAAVPLLLALSVVIAILYRFHEVYIKHEQRY